MPHFDKPRRNYILATEQKRWVGRVESVGVKCVRSLCLKKEQRGWQVGRVEGTVPHADGGRGQEVSGGVWECREQLGMSLVRCLSLPWFQQTGIKTWTPECRDRPWLLETVEGCISTFRMLQWYFRISRWHAHTKAGTVCTHHSYFPYAQHSAAGQ